MGARLDGVVLAAGRSLRMGRPKPLLTIDGETFLARAVRLLRDAGCASVTVVVAARDDNVRSAAESVGATVVVNPYPGSEQIDSLRLAVGALPRDSSAAVVLPVDVPAVRAQTVARLCDAWRTAVATDNAPLALVPTHGDEPGHPVILARTLLPALAAPDLAAGLASVLNAHAERVLSIEVDDPGTVLDVDSPADYERLVATAAATPAAPVATRQPSKPGAAPRNPAWASMLRDPASRAASGHATSEPHELNALHAAAAALAAEAGGPAVASATVLPPSAHAGRRIFVYEDGRTTGTLGDPALDEAAAGLAREALAAPEPLTRAHSSGVQLYAEAFRPPDELLVVGAGHIAVPLARLGLELGFRVTVLDDREEFADTDRFPDGVRVLHADFERDPFAGVTIGARSYVALVTRGHKWDFDCLRRLIELPAAPAYIGMIGSRRRVRAAFSALLDAGTPRDALARIHAPIGLEIGAETPAEIALSIAAELIQVRRGAQPDSLSRKERVLDKLLPANS